jgi:hypothetical protein
MREDNAILTGGAGEGRKLASTSSPIPAATSMSWVLYFQSRFWALFKTWVAAAWPNNKVASLHRTAAGPNIHPQVPAKSMARLHDIPVRSIFRFPTWVP